MEYRTLGRTGVRVSCLCMGTMSFGGDADEVTSAAMFHRYNTVDIDDGREACRKLEEYLQQERYLAMGNPTTQPAKCSHSAPVNKNG